MNKEEGLLAVIPGRRLASVLTSSVVELASLQLNFMLLFWISSVKLLLWYFFPFHLYPLKCIFT